DAADREVHLRELPRRRVPLLAVDREVRALAAVGFDELLRLHEHAARAAAGVEDAALVGLDHLDQHAADRRGRVELAAELALGARELGEEVLVDAAEDVLALVVALDERDVAQEIEQLAEAALVEGRPAVLPARERAAQGRVLLL